MINDVFAPVVKTVFIPTGNPGVQEVTEIRAVPRVVQAEGDDQEITISGEMDLQITYLPINEADEEIPWRTIEFADRNELGQCENEEEVLARLESALKDDQDELGDDREECFTIEISVPFTLAIDTEGFCRDHIVKLDPYIYSSNWFLVSPTAIEFEAVLKLAPQEEAIDAFEIRVDEERLEEEVQEYEQGFLDKEDRAYDELFCTEVVNDPQTSFCYREERQSEAAGELTKPIGQPEVNQNTVQQGVQQTVEPTVQEEIKQTVKPVVQFEAKPAVKPMKQPAVKQESKQTSRPIEASHSILTSKYYFQMKFYRVQLGEDLDAIAEKFGISRERISSLNTINEEEIRTGLLLSIPKN